MLKKQEINFYNEAKNIGLNSKWIPVFLQNKNSNETHKLWLRVMGLIETSYIRKE